MACFHGTIPHQGCVRQRSSSIRWAVSRPKPTGQPSVVHVLDAVPTRPSETFLIRRLAAHRYRPTALHFDVVPSGLPVPCPAQRVASGFPLPRHAAALISHADTLRRLRALKPDVVHVHFGTVGTRVDRQCALLGIPLVVSFYGIDVGSAPMNARVRADYQRLFQNAAALTGEAPVLLRRLRDLGAPSHKLKLLPLCLPSWATFPVSRTLAWSDTPLTLLQVARFVEKKGIDITLRALAVAKRSGVDVRLNLVGAGELEPGLRALAAELGLQDTVRWLGFLPYEQLPTLLAAAHALIQPSKTAANGDTEGGHPTTLVEALAQGVPVLGSTHADIPFVVVDGVTGLLAPEGDAEALADCIVTVARNRDLLVQMGTEGRLRTLKRHDARRLLQLRERIYREAIRR